jgi:hypothetical protein
MPDFNIAEALDPDALELLGLVWIPVGLPGFSGAAKASRKATLDGRFGVDGWRFAHLVCGSIVSAGLAILEYEEAYRRFLRARPALVEFITGSCGNVYDWDVANVYDDDYHQPDTAMNHYQDISVRRVIAKLVDDEQWPTVTGTVTESVELVDLGTGDIHRVPRACGMRGNHLLQIRGPESPGYVLNPAVEAVLAGASRLHAVLVDPVVSEVHRLSDSGRLDNLKVSGNFLDFRHYTVDRFALTMAHLDIGFVGWPGESDDPVVAGIRRVAFDSGKLVIVTMGSRGILVFDGAAGATAGGEASDGHFVRVDAVPVAGTTVGCGDAFIAAFLAALWAGVPLLPAMERAKLQGAAATAWSRPLPDEAY